MAATVRNLMIRISVTEKTNTGIRKVTTSLRETNREVDQANRGSSRWSSTLSKLGRTSLGGLTSGLSAVTRFTATAGKGLLLVASAASALNTVTQAGIGLAPLAGGLALIPAVALAAATAIGVVRLSMVGVGDAFTAAIGSDPKKYADSLKNLAPAARSVAKEVHALRPELLGIQLTAQQNLFRPLTGQLTAMAKVLAGPVKQGVADVAIQFGFAGRSVAEFVRQSESVAVVHKAFNATAGSIHLLLPALQPVLAGLRDLAQVGLSFLPGLAAGASQAATSFGVWLQQLVASGRAAQWISNALATLKQLGGLLANVGGILKSVFSAASAAGSNFLGVIGAALGQLNAFLKTAAGQQALTAIFTALGAIGQTLGPVIGALVGGLGALAPPLAQLAQLVGPILTTAITALAPALAAIAPGIHALFGGLGKAVELVAPALLPLGKAIAQIGVAIGPVLPLVGGLVGQLVAGLAPILGQLLLALSPLVLAVVRFAGALTPLIPPLAQIIVQLVSGLVPALTPIIGLLGRIAGIVGQFLISAIQMLVTAIVPLLPQLSQMAQTIGGQLIIILQALAPALLQVLQALLPILPSLLSMIPVWTQLLVTVTPLVVLLIRLAAVILRTLLPPVVAIVGWLLRFNATVWGSTLGAVASVVGAIAHLPGGIIGALAGAGKWLFNIGKDVMFGFWNGIVSVENWLYNQLVRLIRAIVPAPIRWALGINSPSKVTAELGRFTGMGLAQGMEGTAGLVRRAARTLASAAVPNIPAMNLAGPAGLAASAAAVSAPRGVAAAATGGGMKVTAVIDVQNAKDEFGRAIKKMVRTDGGGDVQVAFGRTS